jgi:hypothetical protein
MKMSSVDISFSKEARPVQFIEKNRIGHKYYRFSIMFRDNLFEETKKFLPESLHTPYYFYDSGLNYKITYI